MKWSKLLAMCARIDETGLVYLVSAEGAIKPVRVEAYLAMTVRELQGTLAVATRGCAERAALRLRGIECGPVAQRN